NLTEAIGKLNVVVENYPELKANQNFLDLQAQLEGTENRIATERMRYNETVKDYNQKVRRFPTNIIAKILGFSARDYFEVSEKDSKVPEVKF
ncbi:MAG: LemA family protein, partial [Peptoniphilaceae bacterium]|nr:LemA family protein [Peptoniphilaceae bacterium]